ncbi:cyclophilin-like fold protein [Gracilimonas mengyeensis]|uniref:Cyclophilin-like domain-containing protein n=1 Tax=Gracilimonas mengyeensis TaxID=1302730 RepID=A0A521D0S5_9BACT|nr:cyclophilin-like fold protein [Gracilimonas mengyeensis]SMO65299.1 hypothetical protein SAMN06265219_1078 [Gracilimonas mengyeensis]
MTLISILMPFMMGVMSFLHPATVQTDQKITEKMATNGSKIEGTITAGSETFTVIYQDNPTAKSLLDQMPFTTELEDYAGIEKIFYPDPALSTKDAPEGAEASKGDVMYYAPWGDVAIFYKDFRYAKGLIPIAHIEDISGFVEALASTNTATFDIQN